MTISYILYHSFLYKCIYSCLRHRRAPERHRVYAWSGRHTQGPEAGEHTRQAGR